jgi:hypothetical protein
MAGRPRIVKTVQTQVAGMTQRVHAIVGASADHTNIDQDRTGLRTEMQWGVTEVDNFTLWSVNAGGYAARAFDAIFERTSKSQPPPSRHVAAMLSMPRPRQTLATFAQTFLKTYKLSAQASQCLDTLLPGDGSWLSQTRSLNMVQHAVLWTGFGLLSPDIYLKLYVRKDQNALGYVNNFTFRHSNWSQNNDQEFCDVYAKCYVEYREAMSGAVPWPTGNKSPWFSALHISGRTLTQKGVAPMYKYIWILFHEMSHKSAGTVDTNPSLSAPRQEDALECYADDLDASTYDRHDTAHVHYGSGLNSIYLKKRPGYQAWLKQNFPVGNWGVPAESVALLYLKMSTV